jgi:hypothetical protein
VYLLDTPGMHESKLRKIVDVEKVPEKGKKAITYQNAKSSLDQYVRYFAGSTKAIAFVGDNSLVCI